MDAPRILFQRGWSDSLINLVRIGNTLAKNLVKITEQIACVAGRKAQPHGFAFSRRNTETIDRGRLRAPLFGVDGFRSSTNEIFVKGVFYVGRGILFAPQSRSIAFVV